ncbi:MAG TPA: PhzF family phenazine biosynthesis protein [Candidatus Acidoferrum sp.]|nr:PhzF family phenazine biosynthesis protein [Candidatus Acidoferrum sp.]
MKRRLYTLDVFTTKEFAGNPLAVITDGDGIAPAVMQAIAREMNLSETVFVQRPTNNRALARLRIFTPTRELPLAGHPVIGTWFLLAELGVVPASEGSVHVLQQTGAGILPVEISFRDGRPERVTMTQKSAQFKKASVNRGALSKALGLAASDLDGKLPLEFVSTGVFNLMVPLRHRRALEKIHVNMRSLAQLIAPHATLAYCFVPNGQGKVFSRGMLPWGMGEDAATGSAAGSLGAYLAKHRRLPDGATLQITQGVEMGRPSEIHVAVQNERGKLVPRVSGSAVRILEAQIEA